MTARSSSTGLDGPRAPGMRLSGLGVLITGAAGGLGRAIAARMAAEGARLLLSDLTHAALESSDPPAGALLLPGDATDPDLHRRLVAAAQREWGGLDIAVNNAGIIHAPARLGEVPAEAARRVIETDLMGVLWAMQAQIPAMEARFAAEGRPGAVVNVASLAGVAGAPGLSAYAAAKHGVVGLTRSAAAESARRGVRVNAVCPAFARTAMVERDLLGAGDPAAAEAHLVRGVPMRRLGEPEEVAQAVVFAAAPENGFMTGQTITVDGGVSAV